MESTPKDGNKNSKFTSEPFEKTTKVLCVFCFGSGCKHENWLNNKNSVIRGLNADWITENILAMQRPSSRLWKEYDIGKQFVDHGLLAIFNFQEPGEHPYCGDGILPSTGFSYDPENDLYPHGISSFNMGWADHSITTHEKLLKITHVMNSFLKTKKKIAVHCHAGKGRTAIGICGYLIIYKRMSADAAIALFQKKRDESLTKESQREMIKDFEKYVRNLRSFFCRDVPYSLDEVLANEKKALDSEYRGKLGNYPSILHEIEGRIFALLESKKVTSNQVLAAFVNPSDPTPFDEEALKKFKKDINHDVTCVTEMNDLRMLAQCHIDFFLELSTSALPLDVLSRAEKQGSPESNGKSLNPPSPPMTPKSSLLKELSKNQSSVVSGVMVFISTIVKQRDTDKDKYIPLVAHSLSTAITKTRNKFPTAFSGRSIVKADEIKDPLLDFIMKAFTEWMASDAVKTQQELETNKSPLQMPRRQPRLQTANLEGPGENGKLRAILQPRSAAKHTKTSKIDINPNWVVKASGIISNGNSSSKKV